MIAGIKFLRANDNLEYENKWGERTRRHLHRDNFLLYFASPSV